MTDLEEIVSKIRRGRSQGEKPVINKFLGLPLHSPSCEICGKVARQGVNQCPYCGRFVGVSYQFFIKEEHKDCWDKAYGCCKICGDFIAKEALEYKNSNRSLPKVQTVQQIQTENPFLDNAIKSLANAIEFVKKKDDRYLQAALIEMDAAVESFLKAKLFKDNPAEFMKSDWEHLTYEKAISKVEQTNPIPEAVFLKAAHTERNKAQHRAVIANITWTTHHLNNIYKFARRFCSEQFNLNIDQILKDIYHIDYIPEKMINNTK